MTLTTRSRASRIVRSRAASSEITESTSSKLPPAEKPLPAPCRIATRASGSRSTARHTSASCAWAAGPTAFSPGASSVMRSTPSDGRSNRSVEKSSYAVRSSGIRPV